MRTWAPLASARVGGFVLTFRPRHGDYCRPRSGRCKPMKRPRCRLLQRREARQEGDLGSDDSQRRHLPSNTGSLARRRVHAGRCRAGLDLTGGFADAGATSSLRSRLPHS